MTQKKDDKDYYKTLGVSQNASEKEIGKAYRHLVMEHHPDRNLDRKEEAEEKFKEIQEAYEVLSVPEKRAYYDQFGTSMGNGGGGAGGVNFSDIEDLFGNIFGDVFGGGRSGRQNQTQRGADFVYNLELNLEDAVHGKTVQIRIPTWIPCTECKGSGAKKGTSPVTCPTCTGHGQVRVQQGFFSMTQTCPDCRGHGQVIREACFQCRGQGRLQKEKTLSVKIPAGVNTGDRIRLQGEGEAGHHGAPSGDLYVQIKLKPHRIFTREGNDLHCKVPISFSHATLGGEIEIPTLEGRIKLKIPPETQSDKLFRLRGKGVCVINTNRTGDLLCRVVVETPINLTRDQKELLTQFAESLKKGGDKHNPQSKSWFDSVKNFFENLAS